MSRLPVAPNVILPAARAAGFEPHPDRQTYTDRMLIPMRRALPPGQTRDNVPNGMTFEPAPAWAAILVRRLSSLVFETTPYEELCALTKRLLSSEQRGLAALVVIGALAGGDANGRDDYKRRPELHDEDEDRSLGMFSAATLVKRLDALP